MSCFSFFPDASSEKNARQGGAHRRFSLKRQWFEFFRCLELTVPDPDRRSAPSNVSAKCMEHTGRTLKLVIELEGLAMEQNTSELVCARRLKQKTLPRHEVVELNRSEIIPTFLLANRGYHLIRKTGS